MINKQEYLLGTIVKSQKQKVYQKNSEFYQQINYKLQVKSVEKTHIFFVYANIVSQQIFTVIQQKTYWTKHYLFTVKKNKWGWILLDWLER